LEWRFSCQFKYVSGGPCCQEGFGAKRPARAGGGEGGSGAGRQPATGQSFSSPRVSSSPLTAAGPFRLLISASLLQPSSPDTFVLLLVTRRRRQPCCRRMRSLAANPTAVWKGPPAQKTKIIFGTVTLTRLQTIIMFFYLQDRILKDIV
jgi:hypothetical protein